MEIFSGAGGVDAQDWAGMLFRMYQRYAEKNRFSFKVLQESWGEQRGLKSATVEIKGPHAYGYLKKESGQLCYIKAEDGREEHLTCRQFLCYNQTVECLRAVRAFSD